MKKITLLLFLFIAFSWQSNAQFTEGFETEIPATWTVINNGSANGWVQETSPSGGAQEGTGVASILYDAAIAHDDYLITPQIVVTAGVNDRLVFYIKSRSASFLEPYEVLLSTTDALAGSFTVTLQASMTAPNIWTEIIIDLSAYATQSVYVAIRATGTNEFQLFVDNVVNDTQTTDTADWNNLQWPPNGAITTGDPHDVFAQIYEAGLTDVTSGQAPGIEAWIGTSTADTDPSTGGWTWTPAIFNTEVGNNDEYMMDIGSSLSAGTYYYASRFRLNGGPFTYGGTGGFWASDSGVLTVTDPPPPANDDCSGAITVAVGIGACGADVTGTNQSATDSGVAQATCATATYSGGDIWYTFTMPAGETDLVFTRSASAFSTTQVELYGDTCGALTEIDCTTAASNTFTGLTASATYYLRLYDWGNDDIGDVTFCLGTPPPPPANDDCAGAIALTPGTVFTDNPVVGTNASTSDSGETLPGCASYSGGDLWYSVVVPPDGNITLEMDSNPTGSGGDAGGAAYSGSCGALVLISCNDDGGPGLYPQVVVSDPGLAGQTIYFRVWEFGNNATIDFQVSAYSATLGLDDNKIEGFKFYPNPVNDILNLRAQSNIQNVSIYNMLGQEVSRISPNIISSDVDMSALQTGVYFVNVTINGDTETIRIIKQ